MRYKYQIIILSITILFISACEERNVESLQEIQFDIDKAKRIKLSELADTIRFIRLMTPNDLQISNISMLRSTNDYLVIQGTTNPPSLVVFKRDGEFVSEINSYGKGPGEYNRISSFFIDNEKKHIELMDRLSRKKLTFTIHNEFIEENIGKKWGGECIIKQDNNYVVYYGNTKFASDYKIGIYDENYKKIASYLKIPNNYVDFFHIVDNFNFSKYNGETLFWHALSPYVYFFDQDGLHKKYEIDFGIHNIPNKLFNLPYDNVASFMQRIWDMDYASIVGAAGEGDRFLFFRGFKGKDSFYHYFYDKKNNTAQVVNGYQDDLLFDQDWNLKISDISVVAYQNNKLYFAIDAYQMNQIISHEEDETQQKTNFNELVSKTIGDITIYDNPILIELSLKE